MRRRSINRKSASRKIAGASPANNLLFLNHYKIKSKEEWELKIKTTNNYGYMKGKWVDQPFASNDLHANEKEDLGILRFVPALKEFMKKDLTLNPKVEPFFLVLVCMFRDENLYLKEFLDYYILQGVDHFYLYDNENPESTKAILEPYIRCKYVTLIEWKDSVIDTVPKSQQRTRWNDYKQLSTQNLAFYDFMTRFKKDCQYVLKCDIDEFVYPALGYKSVRSVLKKEFDKRSTRGIWIPRRDFGSSGHITKPDGLVIENYTKAAKETSHSKSIGNSTFIKKPSYGAHSFDY